MSREDGALELGEVKSCPGWPGEECLEKRKVAVLECVEDIPCNPCEVACPTGAIVVGTPITNLPRMDGEKCTGCGLCVAICPGLAIFLVERNRPDGKAAVTLPCEILPLPRAGDEVRALDRKGNFLCRAKVLRVHDAKKYDRTRVVTVSVEKRFCDEARGIEVASHE
jgi:formate hydrogenlyase subunit 6/NADH:ubiquinone oxidoreductase subunit I